MHATVEPATDTTAIERRLAEDGWRVDLELKWVVEASRAGEIEQAVGATREEALLRLAHLVRLVDAPHVP